ncbi:LOW QUALITY PROTEIN: IQ motif-containing protein H [Pholidichthys leucotaenia]
MPYSNNLGVVLVQVQADLKQLKSSLKKITVSRSTLDIEALVYAIHKTECSISASKSAEVNCGLLSIVIASGTSQWAKKEVRKSVTTSVVTKPKLMVPVPIKTARYPFTIKNGQTDPIETDFCHFKLCFSLCWSSVSDALEALTKLLRDYAIPVAKVSGEHLVKFSHSWGASWRNVPQKTSVLSVLENWEEVLGLVLQAGQCYKGEGSTEAAAIRIQSCWKGHVTRTAYLCCCQRKWAAGTIAISLMHAQLCCVRKVLQARFSQLENIRNRAQHLAANWKHIQSSKRTIIHIRSLGYSRSQRLNLRGLDILQNIQTGRPCEISMRLLQFIVKLFVFSVDENVAVIYICPQHLGDNILDYYSSLLKCDGATDGANASLTQASYMRRFIILTPEAVDYFPTHNMCLSTLLKYSARTLKCIRNLIQGRDYIVGGVAHVDDLAVADELGVPILGPEPAVAQLHGSKSGGRRLSAEAEVNVPPGQGDIYSQNQFHEILAELMTQNMDVQRCLFKIDSQYGGRGTAYCDTCHLFCYSWALRYRRHGPPELWNTKIQESVFLRYLDEIPEWLTHYSQPGKTSHYPNWTCFLKTFLRQGQIPIVEWWRPTSLTADLLLEPGGRVATLSCGDKLDGSCWLDIMGSTVPQTSVHPETLHAVCIHVRQACLQRRIVGYISVDLVTFLDRTTMEQKVWALDLDITYSSQLAMTQMLVMVTGGMLNCHTGCLEVPMPIRVKGREQELAAKCNFVIYVSGEAGKTVFAPYDSSKHCNMPMMTVSGDLQGALVTFARNLSVIHQEISSSKTQGEINFKVPLIKNIEDILQMVAQNMVQMKAKPAA